MDGPALAAKVAAGYATAAAKIGFPVQQFRATGPNNPIGGTPLATLTGAFDQDAKYGFTKPWDRKKPEGYALINPTTLALGDYLVAADTYFVQRLEPYRPPEVVLTNRTMSVIAATGTTTTDQGPVGFSPTYDGPTQADETADTVATGWPVSCLQGTKGETDPARLPGDVRAPWWLILMPAIPTVTITRAMMLQDEAGNTYSISSAELTPWGYRITAVQDVD